MTKKTSSSTHISDYGFRDMRLLETALTHSSASSTANGIEDNQRLEFLGDRVLGLIIAEELLKRHQTENEGSIAPRLNNLVRKEACAEVAKSLNLGTMIRLSASEAKSGGRRKMALLGDAMEAVIAAIYLDGGLDAARTFVLKHWSPLFDRQQDAPVDAKSALQEWVQARKIDVPEYKIINRQGPDHNLTFTVKATLKTTPPRTATAKASTKRDAEQMAAKILLDELS
jgi:ribonuclease-3